jgi:threonine/homoserine/homoserine lactone efflux protein
MPPTDRLLTFLLASFVLIVIPGPSVLFTIGRALSAGRRAGLYSVAGNATGVFVQVLAVAVGVGALVQRSTELYTAIKFVGAAYLIYLGVQAFRHRHALSTAIAAPAEGLARPRRMYLDAVLVGVANPKTIVFFTVALPQFTDRSAGHVPLQLMFLGAAFTAIALACDSVWAVAAGSAREWLARSPRRLAAIGGTGGVAIVGLGITVAVSGRAD